MALKFLDYKVQNANFSLTPNIAPNKNYKITPKISCNVRRTPERLFCVFTVELAKGEEPIPFEFKVVGIGTFSLDRNEDAKSYAVKAAETTFPFVRQSVAGLTQLANIPPYVLPIINIEEILSDTKQVQAPLPTNLN